MLALRLTRGARFAVQLRRLLVVAASAGTGFLLLCALGHAMSHPEAPGASALRLAWCAAPLAATVYFAVAVARTDPGTRPRPGLSAIGLGPARLMAISVTTTALACTLGSTLALLVFLHLRGDLTGMPFDAVAADFLAADQPLPLPAALTLLILVPAISSLSVLVVLRPREAGTPPAEREGRRVGRFGAHGMSVARETFGAYGRFGAHLGGAGRRALEPQPADGVSHAAADARSAQPAALIESPPATWAGETHPAADVDGTPAADTATDLPALAPAPPAPREAPGGLPWGIAVLAAGLAVEAYASHITTPSPTLLAALSSGPVGVLVGWALTAVGLALAGPGLTHLCGRLLQCARPGALRLLAGRVLMQEAVRIGRPLGVVCAVASAAYATATLYAADGPTLGPLSALGALLVAGCAVATLLTAAVEAKQARADTNAALLRLGAPATTLRGAVALRVAGLLAMFGPLTLIVAELASLPLAP
ncbi:hypothetical protein [Streptomyces sp. S.PNR 29]|uniref:hypothetical protein n=1 Tax=Streptomyces sp. S.PNR 29 TaxID=2973805 RepID=UPI0025B02500|nr:hypothetical protein [Streptomyces sp. S.PNR 29]MDN0199739.1 hypothetical protein [Streptomyces sp. S.PNR 29]